MGLKDTIKKGLEKRNELQKMVLGSSVEFVKNTVQKQSGLINEAYDKQKEEFQDAIGKPCSLCGKIIGKFVNQPYPFFATGDNKILEDLKERLIQEGKHDEDMFFCINCIQRHKNIGLKNFGISKEFFNYKIASPNELKKEYNRIAKESGDLQFLTKKELDYLPEILQDTEQVIAFSSGLMDSHSWLIVLTDRRIIFLDKGMIYGLKQEVIPLNRVSAVSGSTGILFGDIVITDGAKNRKITNVLKKTVKIFTNRCQEAIDAISQRQYQPQISQNTQSQIIQKTEQDPYEKLEKLANLKEKGIISQEEFEEEKKKILG